MTEHIQASISIPIEHAASRVDRVAGELLPQFSRARLQTWIKQGHLTVNGKMVKPKDKVQVKDLLELDVQLEPEGDWEAEEIRVGYSV